MGVLKMKIIALNKGLFAQIDDEDFDKVSQKKWYAERSRSIGTYYARTYDGIRLHRFVLNESDPKIIIDHKDNDGLNCQKLNLRRCTAAQNMMNRRVTGKGSSKYKGVVLDKRSLKYGAKIRVNTVGIWIGTFKTEKEAAEAYNKSALKYFGEFAKLNIIE